MDKRRILVPAGASVRGRIRRLERASDGGKYYVVGLEFTHIETSLGTARFYANLQDLEKRPNVKLILSNVAGVAPIRTDLDPLSPRRRLIFCDRRNVRSSRGISNDLEDEIGPLIMSTTRAQADSRNTAAAV